MQTISLKLWHHYDENWTVQINDCTFEHISSETLEGLVDFALVTAQQQLKTAVRVQADPA